MKNIAIFTILKQIKKKKFLNICTSYQPTIRNALTMWQKGYGSKMPPMGPPNRNRNQKNRNLKHKGDCKKTVFVFGTGKA